MTRRLECHASSERILRCAEAAIGREIRNAPYLPAGMAEDIADGVVASLMSDAGVPAPVIGFHLRISDRRMEAALQMMALERERRPEIGSRLAAIAAELPRWRPEGAGLREVRVSQPC